MQGELACVVCVITVNRVACSPGHQTCLLSGSQWHLLQSPAAFSSQARNLFLDVHALLRIAK